jgi:D-lactate dehydrogenase (cytochrome)
MEILQHDIPIARMELMDELSIEAVIKYSKLDDTIKFDEGKPALFFEFHASSEKDVEKDVSAVKDIASGNGAVVETDFKYETDLEKRSSIWKARHQLYYACLNLKPNSKGVVTDVAVPISCLVDMVTGAQSIFRRNDVIGKSIQRVY